MITLHSHFDQIKVGIATPYGLPKLIKVSPNLVHEIFPSLQELMMSPKGRVWDPLD